MSALINPPSPMYGLAWLKPGQGSGAVHNDISRAPADVIVRQYVGLD